MHCFRKAGGLIAAGVNLAHGTDGQDGAVAAQHVDGARSTGVGARILRRTEDQLAMDQHLRLLDATPGIAQAIVDGIRGQVGHLAGAHAPAEVASRCETDKWSQSARTVGDAVMIRGCINLQGFVGTLHALLTVDGMHGDHGPTAACPVESE